MDIQPSQKLLDSVFARLKSAYDPDATVPDPADVTRWAIEDHVRSLQPDPGRTLKSRGVLRLHGEGVEGNSAPLQAVGDVAMKFQDLIDAMGSSLRGVKTAKGRLPNDVLKRTKLDLVASPAAGSGALIVAPHSDPAEETAPEGQVSLFSEDSRQLADQAIEATLNLLELGSRPDPVADDFVERIQEWGPRVASAILKASNSFSKRNFDLEISWKEPSKKGANLDVTAEQFGRIFSVIDRRELTQEDIVFVGKIQTVSNVVDLDLEIVNAAAETELIKLSREELEGRIPSDLQLDEEVKVQARADYTLAAGGTLDIEYFALEVTRASPDEH